MLAQRIGGMTAQMAKLEVGIKGNTQSREV
jgi:hypothetical protein